MSGPQQIMFHDQIYRTHVFSPERALAAGFVPQGDKFAKRIELDEEGFYVVFEVSAEHAESQVFEEPDGEEYLPYHVTDTAGGFANSIRENVERLFSDVMAECFVMADVKMLLLEYVRQRYETVPEAPWDYLAEHHTLKTQNSQKWYGIFMFVPYTCLGLDEEGKVNVLNVKASPDDIPKIVDGIHYFPAYHMNKKYWMSVLLDRDADVEFVKKLLDDSYALVEGKGKKKG